MFLKKEEAHDHHGTVISWNTEIEILYYPLDVLLMILTCESEEALCQDRLGQHPVLDLVEADGLVVPPPVPPGDVEQVTLRD